jgi:hypothetical protein
MIFVGAAAPFDLREQVLDPVELVVGEFKATSSHHVKSNR